MAKPFLDFQPISQRAGRYNNWEHNMGITVATVCTSDAKQSGYLSVPLQNPIKSFPQVALHSLLVAYDKHLAHLKQYINSHAVRIDPDETKETQ